MFKVDCGGDRFSDVSHLSDGQLASKLRELGADIGPIIDATRKVYQRKLQRWLQSRNPRYNADINETQEKLEKARTLVSHQAPESKRFSTSLQHQESSRQAGGCTRTLLKDAEPSGCKEPEQETFRDVFEMHSAESLGERIRNPSPGRAGSHLRFRSHDETGEEESMYEYNRTKTSFEGGISSTSQRTYTASVSAALLQPGSRSLPEQVEKHRIRKPRIMAGIFVIMLLCLLFVLIVFNMEPEYQNPAQL